MAWSLHVSADVLDRCQTLNRKDSGFFCEGDEPEAMMQVYLQIMAPGDRSSSSAEHEMMAEPPYRVGQI
jgi:hypothetical protein